MSRIGKKPVVIPAGVEVKCEDSIVTVKGPLGELKQDIASGISVSQEGSELIVTRATDNRQDRADHGLYRSLIANIVEGVGYRVEKKGSKLVMQLGFSHPVEMEDPEGITTETPDANTVLVKGIDKAEVGNYAAVIRKWRKPEPYKGKGIRYDGEHIRRKEGKTGAKA